MDLVHQNGQHFSTNVDKLFETIYDKISPQLKEQKIIEPFCGQGDLVKYVQQRCEVKLEMYDLFPNFQGTVQRDTLKSPPNYDGAFVITNPPYIAKNKCDDAELFTEPYLQDKYHIFIDQISKSKCLGGILILPINFLTSRDTQLRKIFMQQFKILFVNIFREKIFDDTTQAVIAFSFIKNENTQQDFIIPACFVEDSIQFDMIFEDFIIGKEIEKKYETQIDYKRYTKKQKGFYLTNILIQTLDPNIMASFDGDVKLNKETDRSKLNLMTNYIFTEEQQRIIIRHFNEQIQYYRNIYYSLCFSSYREFNRKRLSFEQVYIIIDNIIGQYILDNTFEQKLRIEVNRLYEIETKNFIENIQEYDQKIQNVYEHCDFFKQMYDTFEDYKKFIYQNKRNPFVIKQFIKEPGRQGIHEKLQIEILQQRFGCQFQRNIDIKLTKTKTFDGVNHERKIFLVCKYIHEAGGSQDNQFNDAMRFNDYAHETNYKIFICISGHYGTQKVQKWKKENNLKENVEILII